MELTQTILFVVTCVTFLYYYLTRKFDFWKNKGVVGPKPVPLFGNIALSALRKKHYGVTYKEIYDSYPGEKIVGIFRMTTPALLIRDVDIIKNIMIKDFDVFVDRGVEFCRKGLGANLFHADGDTWRMLRHQFNPLFSPGKVKNMLHLITERGEEFIKCIEEIVEKDPEQEMYSLMQKITLTTIAATVFGVDIDTRHDPEVMKTLKKIDKSIFSNSFFKELDMMYPGILKIIGVSIFPALVKKFFCGLVRDVFEQRNGVPSDRNDFMDLIMELKRKGKIHELKKNKQLSIELTEDVIAALALTFYAGGYETSATTMAFMLYELAKNPDVQEKLIAEIDATLDKFDGKITYETIQEMSYLDKVFDETLRLHPVVDPLQRKASADYHIPGTNVTIPKGTTVLVSVTGIHQDPKYWTDPEKFDIERHSTENSRDRHPCTYLPFGIGPRHCMAMRFAKVQARVCMIKLFSKFRVQISRNTPIEIKLDPRRLPAGPDCGIRLNLVRR